MLQYGISMGANCNTFFLHRFKCGICDTKFVYKCLLKNHMATHERNNIPVKIEGDTCVLDISDSVASFIQFQEFTT